MYTCRKATYNDIESLKQIYRDTILCINSKDYPENEISDWASCGNDNERWVNLINDFYFIIAIDNNDNLQGFAAISDTGYLNSLFVHKDFQNQGTGSFLYHEIENYAIEMGIENITSEVSITAKPFFEKQGFIVNEEHRRKANRLSIINYKMTKKLFKNLDTLTNEELWQLFPIILTEHNYKWFDFYEEEKAKLVEIIEKHNIVRISHIGSTSVRGLIAKPTIDILVEIQDNSDLEELVTRMKSHGYIYSPQPSKPAPHMMFMKGYTPRGFSNKVFHVHVRYKGDWDELYFRDYLIAYPEISKQYGELKLKLKNRYEYDRDSYTDAKTEFILNINKIARNELSGRYKI